MFYAELARGWELADRMIVPPPTTGLECLVYIDERLAGVLRFRDTARVRASLFYAEC